MLGVHIEKEVEMYHHHLASFRELPFRYMDLVCIPVFGYYNTVAPACQDAEVQLIRSPIWVIGCASLMTFQTFIERLFDSGEF